MSLNEQDLLDLYQDLILDHSRYPHNFYEMEKAQCQAVGHNPLCGDRLVLYVTADEQGRIKEASFQGQGCAISMASASMMTDLLKGKTAQEAEKLAAHFEQLCKNFKPDPQFEAMMNPEDNARLDALAGVKNYPARVKCAMLSWRTLQAALNPAQNQTVQTENT
ncbi:MAG: SUF system NifU family Fe-S cluster assembly protein [Alphaproteobacteria bacterium]|nr:SUF system NifU family Fe-S cluster assembly protein [Alphaproteobacteria bacterium]